MVSQNLSTIDQLDMRKHSLNQKFWGHYKTHVYNFSNQSITKKLPQPVAALIIYEAQINVLSSAILLLPVTY